MNMRADEMKAPDLVGSSLEDPEIRAHFEREWLADEIIAALEQRMKELGISRAELARKLKCTPANVTKLFRRGTNLTLSSIVDLALAIDHRFLPPQLEPISATPPWIADETTVLAPAKAWFVSSVDEVPEAVPASPSVAWPAYAYATEGEAGAPLN